MTEVNLRRKPKLAVPMDEPLDALHWYSLDCQLITPMYGGGVEAATVDLAMPIRASSIRGQLRFWWRLLAKYKWTDVFGGDDKVISKAEFALWGGQNDKDSNEGQASKVFSRVIQPKTNMNNLKEWQSLNLPYVMFPASNETDSTISHDVFDNQEIWQLCFAFDNKLGNNEKNQVIETLQWWANFGGIGARTRKGLGAVRVVKSQDFPIINTPLLAEEVIQANCLFKAVGSSDNPLQQLQNGIRKLINFRQGANVGRNTGSPPKPAGRSRWSEPDAIRCIQNKTANGKHVPEHPAGNVFPRALFGMPIIFHFVGAGEPSDSQLIPTFGERLASPVIIRPYFNGEKYQAMLLVLPYENLLTQKVTLGRGQAYPIWNKDTAQHIKPIQDNGGSENNDPLKAFLHYF